MSVLTGLTLKDSMNGHPNGTNLSSAGGAWQDMNSTGFYCQYWSGRMAASGGGGYPDAYCSAFWADGSAGLNERASVLIGVDFGQPANEYMFMLWLRVYPGSGYDYPNGYVCVGYPDGLGNIQIEIYWTSYGYYPAYWSYINGVSTYVGVGDRVSFSMDDTQYFQVHINEDLAFDGYDYSIYDAGDSGIGVANTYVGLDDFYSGDYTAVADTTPPIPNVTSVATTKISRVVGKDAANVTFTADENFVEYEVRRVPLTTSGRVGTLIETAVVSARTSHTITITDDELIAASGTEGSNLLKVFVKDAAGNWST